ncbi:MAG: cation-translocating P-type ATPase [Spirochaetales bacterium]|nr:cation-translocating P-type ATPase [Spirochaetales bacterium]
MTDSRSNSSAEPWYARSVEDSLSALGSDPALGLSEEKAARRLQTGGPNELVERGGKGPLKILARQFLSLMVALLVGAALVSGVVLGEWEDALVILVIVVLNAVLGFWQEYRAERALEALKAMSRPLAKVRRGGQVREIPGRELVPGDVVLLEAGSLIPADARLLESANLKAQEAALTGEAEAVEKHAAALAQEELPLGDRRNMVYMGTVVTYGRGTAVVTATGMRTELGRIAGLLEETPEERTVLQRKLAQLTVFLVFAALALIALVGLEGWLLRGLGLKELFMTAVSMAVAAIPEGLPAVVTIALALGAQRMLKRRALIRRLSAVETLGSVTVICTDKTGTLTQNRMTATLLELPDRRLELPRGETPAEIPADDAGAWLLLAGGALCSDAVLRSESEAEPAEASGSEPVSSAGDRFQTLGDPTEGALVAAAARVGLEKQLLEQRYPRVGELPFDSERKRMTTVHALDAEAAAGASGPIAGDPPGGGLAALPEAVRSWVSREEARHLAFTKGAVDSLLEVSSFVWTDQGPQELGPDRRQAILEANDRLAGQGIRVLGVAVRTLDRRGSTERPSDRGSLGELAVEELERGLVFVGMTGMLDPLRPEVKVAVETCRRAGIRPVMITGDHPLIARSIAKELGISGADQAMTGAELARLPAEEISARVQEVSVYARVAPEHKLKIVDALQEHGEIVAMTGDGVNDAPALKTADIGVAMGITGTDVSKEASDMVLQDDNFATILAAVEEGRIIFDNILRFVRYIISANCAEILVMIVAPLLGMPLPLYPVQILWMNLVTDGLPALALGVEPGEPDVMSRRPRSPKAPILTRSMGLHILWVGLLMAVLALAAGVVPYRFAERLPEWRTMLFTTLVFCQLTLALVERSNLQSLFRLGLLSNRAMLWAVGGTFGLQLAVIYVPFLQGFFKTMPLRASQLGICALLSLAMIAALEGSKAIARGRLRKTRQNPGA